MGMQGAGTDVVCVCAVLLELGKGGGAAMSYVYVCWGAPCRMSQKKPWLHCGTRLP